MAFIAYWPCLHGPLLWDDKDWTSGIDWLMRDPAAPKRIWSDFLVVQQYYPLTTTSFWLDRMLAGGRWSVGLMHSENVLWHAFGGIGLWWFLRALRIRGAWFAAALFIMHPVMVESVAWITERKNVLCFTLMMGSLIAWARAVDGWQRDEGPKRLPAIIATVLLLLALLAKITAFIVPPALLIIAWWKRGRLRWRQDVMPVMPMFACAFALGLLVSWIEKHHTGASGTYFDQLTPSMRLLIASEAWSFYLMKLLWPHPVCVLYHRWNIDPSVWWHWLAPVAVVGLIGLLWRSKKRVWIASVLLYSAALFPVLGFMNLNGMRYAWVADRWVYFASPVVFAWIAAMLMKWDQRWPRQVVMACVLIICGLLTRRQAANYGDFDAFWKAAIAGSSSPVVAHNGYADMLLRAGRFEEALAHADEAIRLDPTSAGSHCTRGSVLNTMSRVAEALPCFERSLELDPTDALVTYNKGFVLYQLGRIEEAIATFEAALRLDPRLLPAHTDLASLLSSTGRQDAAEEHFMAALKLRPGDPSSLSGLGNLRLRQGREADALKCYAEAREGDPTLITAFSNAAMILASTTDPALANAAEALRLAEQADELTAHANPGIRHILAAAHAAGQNLEKALEIARDALRMAEEQNQSGAAAILRRAIGLYEAGKPWRRQ